MQIYCLIYLFIITICCTPHILHIVSDHACLQCAQQGGIITSKAGQARLASLQPRGTFADLLIVILRPEALDGDSFIMCDFKVNPIQFRLPVYLKNAGQDIYSFACNLCSGVKDTFDGLYLQCTMM